MEEAVVFEAAAAEERVEGVQTLFTLHRLGERAVHVGRAERRKLYCTCRLQQILIPDTERESEKEFEGIFFLSGNRKEINVLTFPSAPPSCLCKGTWMR